MVDVTKLPEAEAKAPTHAYHAYHIDHLVHITLRLSDELRHAADHVSALHLHVKDKRKLPDDHVERLQRITSGLRHAEQLLNDDVTGACIALVNSRPVQLTMSAGELSSLAAVLRSMQAAEDRGIVVDGRWRPYSELSFPRCRRSSTGH